MTKGSLTLSTTSGEMSDEKGPLIVLAEERPVYLFTGDGEPSCPGEKTCLIKAAFSRPYGRCIIRVLRLCAADVESSLMFAHEQVEELVIRSCAECRYNPVARAVIDELVNPKPRESIEYAPRGMRTKFNMGDFFKDYVTPEIQKHMLSRSKVLDRFLQAPGLASGLPKAHARLGGPPKGRRATVKITDDLVPIKKTASQVMAEALNDPIPAIADLSKALTESGEMRSRSLQDQFREQQLEHNRMVAEMMHGGMAKICGVEEVPWFHVPEDKKEKPDDNDED